MLSKAQRRALAIANGKGHGLVNNAEAATPTLQALERLGFVNEIPARFYRITARGRLALERDDGT